MPHHFPSRLTVIPHRIECPFRPDPKAQSKPIDDQKAKTYSQGVLRKSKREKEKEAEAAKREEEEREAAKAYAEFLDAFDAPSTSSTGGSKSKTLGFVKASDGSGKAQAYEPIAPRNKEGIPTGPRVVSDFDREHIHRGVLTQTPLRRPRRIASPLLLPHLRSLNRKASVPWTCFWKSSRGAVPCVDILDARDLGLSSVSLAIAKSSTHPSHSEIKPTERQD